MTKLTRRGWGIGAFGRLAAGAAAWAGIQGLARADDAPAKPAARSQHLAIIRPKRPDFLRTMTDDEKRVMAEHFEYLKAHAAAGRVVLAGPCLSDPPFGIIVIEAATEAEARALAEGDPSVVAGVNSLEFHPMAIAIRPPR